MNGHYPDPIDPTRTRIGWIGIGIMGGPMASRLISAGYSVTIYARNPSTAATLLSLGAKLAATPADLATSSDVIFTVIGGPSDVKHLILNTLIPCLNPNTVLIDHTTSDPSLARQIHRSALARGCYSIDAPVSGADVGAREGKLAIFAGGDREIVDWAKPVFDLLGRVNYMRSAGKGQICKFANQITGSANLVGVSEGLVFAEKAGLDKERFLEAVSGGAAGSRIMELFGKRMAQRDFEPTGYVEYLVKDLGMMEEEGVALPGVAVAKQLFTGMMANGDGKLGIHGVIGVIERINGIGG